MDGYTYPKPRGDSGTVAIGDCYIRAECNVNRQAYSGAAYSTAYSYAVAPPADYDGNADSDFELDSPNWLHDALPHGERVNDPRRNRISNADAAYSCSQRNPECNAGDECVLHRYCGAWGPVRGGGGSSVWQRLVSAGRRVLGAVRAACGWHGCGPHHGPRAE